MSADKKPVPEVGQKESSVKSKQPYDYSQLIWGGLFIVVGGLFLLGNFNVLDVNVAGLIKLWPILIILVGVSILATKSTVGAVVAGIVAIAVLSLVVLVGSGLWGSTVDPTQVVNTSTQSERDAERADVSIDTGVGTLVINSTNQDDIISTEISGDEAYISEDSELDGSTQRIKISTTLPRNLTTVGRAHDLNATLTESMPLSLDLNIGASQLDADLSSVMLEKLSLEAGATQATIRLGERQKEIEVVVEAGASSITIEVPKQSGVQVKGNAGLSNVDLDDFEEVEEGLSQTSNYDSADNKITIVFSGGVSSFEVERY